MKLTALLIIICLLYSCEKSEDVPCSNRFIIAGASDNCFEIIDIEPDSIVSAFSETYGSPKSAKSTFESYIDMSLRSKNGFWSQNDNIDFQFKLYYSTAGGMSIIQQGVDLLTFDNEYLEYSAAEDSAYLNIYNHGDTIHKNDLWLNNNGIRLSYSSSVMCLPNCPGDNSAVNGSLSDRYLGLRIANEADTNYYWYRIDVNDFHQLTIKEFGRKSN